MPDTNSNVDESLSGAVDGTPERFVPDEMRGELIEAEHLSRYRWACRFVRDRRVLDAGCGLGYGAAMAAEAGAASVVGVDISEAVITAARQLVPEAVDLRVGDVSALEFEDGEFDAIVCFETLEHVDDPLSLLSELARVLSDDGLLIVSTPNRASYVPGNPHHRREFLPEELREALEARFEHVALVRQDNWLATAILDDAAYAASHDARLDSAEVRKILGRRPGTEVYTLGVASNAELPANPPFATLADPVEVKDWLAYMERQQREFDACHDALVKLQSVKEEHAKLRWALEQAEMRLLHLPEVELEAQTLRERAERAERVQRDLMHSVSWRITRPLRWAKRIVRES